MKKSSNFLVLLALLFTQPSFAQDSTSIHSAFFGLDDALPFTANLLCLGATGQDGMPLNFNYAIDNNSLDASDFEVIDQAGTIHTPFCATLAPANDLGENRTVLLIGDFGTGGSNPPVEVWVIGDLFSMPEDSNQSACAEPKNLNGAFTQNVTPLSAGPSLFFAQKIEGSISECPSGTTQTIQVAWDGGVVPISSSIDESDLHQYYTLYSDSVGILIPHQADTIFDVNDNDNFHQLCLSTTDSIVKVDFQANIVEDPNADPNLFAEVELSYCASPISTGLNEYSNSFELSIFPNPAKDYIQLYLKGWEGETWLRIYTQTGILLLNQDLNTQSQATIDISSLAKGFYILECINSQQQQSKILILSD